MNKKILWVAIAAFCVVHTTGICQSDLASLQLKFQHGRLDEVINELRSEAENGSVPAEKIVLLSSAYAEKGNLAEAEKWISKLTDSPEAGLIGLMIQGTLLKKMGRYKEAKEVYNELAKTDSEKVKPYLDGCDYALNLYEEHSGENTRAVPYVATESQEFAAGIWKDLQFHAKCNVSSVASRIPGIAGKFTEGISTEKGSIFRNETSQSSISLSGALNTDIEGRYFAWISHEWRGDYPFTDIKKAGALMIGEFNEKGEVLWTKPFPFNDASTVIHSACLSSDGNTLIFSSDRPGGYGGFDLYQSQFSDSKWTEPVNLGSIINSSKDEITPYISMNHELYFSSDQIIGLGGFDIFSAIWENEKWGNLKNLGIAINSPEDECYPFKTKTGDIYFASNRIGSNGGKDIYVWYRKNEPIAMVYEEEIPKAILLEDQQPVGSVSAQDLDMIHTVSYRGEAKTEVLPVKNINDGVANIRMIDFNSVDLSSARRIAINELLPDNEVFFIQLASVTAGKPDFERFASLLKYGNIYKMINNRAVKVRLGYFTDKTEAEAILAKVKSNGFRDAFLAQELLNKAQMELVMSGKDDKDFSDNDNFGKKGSESNKSDNAGSRYKVRLAAYEDPIWFDVNKVRDLGRIEQWTKGDWTIFIMAGYQSLEEAKEARIKAVNRGFGTAEVVIDNNGMLEKLRQQ